MTIPKIDIPAVPPGEDAAMYINSRTDPTVFGAYMRFYVAAKELPPADPELIELLRLRNGVAQSCQYCLSVRMEGGYEFGSDIEHVLTHFETSDLSDRQKAALRLAAAFLEVPSELTQDARAEAQKYFTTDEIVGLLFKLTSFLINKSRAALGIDAALDPEKITKVVSGESVQKYLPES